MEGFSFRVVLLAVVVAAAPAAHAQANEALEVAKRLVVSSGLAVQLKSFLRQMEQDIEQARGRMPDEKR